MRESDNDADAEPFFARRYTGFFEASVPGNYIFYLGSDDGSILWLDGNPDPLISNLMGTYLLSTYT